MQSETATHRPPGGTTCPRTCISHTSGQVERAIGPTALQRAQDCILAEGEGLGCPVRFPRGAMSWRQGRLWGLTWTHLCLEQPFLAVAALKVIMFFKCFLTFGQGLAFSFCPGPRSHVATAAWRGGSLDSQGDVKAGIARAWGIPRPPGLSPRLRGQRVGSRGSLSLARDLAVAPPCLAGLAPLRRGSPAAGRLDSRRRGGRRCAGQPRRSQLLESRCPRRAGGR